MPKNPLIAAFLSFLIGGLGQLYLGLRNRAVAFFILELSTAAFTFTVHEQSGMILNFMVSLVASIDAYIMAKRMPQEAPTPTINKYLPEKKIKVI